MNFLTTAACTVNPLYTSNGLFNGIPASLMRPTDYHMMTVTANSPGSSRSTSLVFRELIATTMSLPAPLPVPTVTSPPGRYRRLQANVGPIPNAYGESLSLRYTDGRTMTSVFQSVAYGGNGEVVIAMPDLSGVSGWSSAYAIDGAATVTWTLTADGSAGGPLCSADRTAVRASRSGVL
jgi:hypothetical protein